MKIDETLLRNYAKSILKIGVNLHKGQNLLIDAAAEQWPFVNILAEEAYKAGARFVKVRATDPHLLRARLDHADESTLDYVPPFESAEVQSMIDDTWALIHLEGPQDPHLFDDANPERISTIEKARRQVRLPLSIAMMNGRCPWVIAPVPTAKWAAQVLGKDPSPATTDEFWNVLIPILSLDKPDPVAVWSEHSATLKKRAKVLNDTQYEYVRFEGPGTDLKIFLSDRAWWHGGVFKSHDDRDFLPNFPTFEVFTTPDYRLTQGRVQVTCPVRVLGRDVEGAWFQFKDGRVMDFGADVGAETLQRFFEVDEQSRYLGEVALVDINSPIYQTNTLFHSILLDENAACHMALGRGLSIGIRDGGKLSPEEMKAIGCNDSLQHTDFMIGSPEISVFGGKNDKEDPIIRAGTFVI